MHSLGQMLFFRRKDLWSSILYFCLGHVPLTSGQGNGPEMAFRLLF